MTITTSLLCLATCAAQEGPFRLAVAGLAHGHASGFLQSLEKRKDVDLAGVWEPDAALRSQYGARYKIPAERLYGDLSEMIGKARPEAVAIFTSTFDHAAVVEACAKAKVPAMMEKPLAVSVEHGRRIEKAARAAGIPVIVNYETTWYRTHAAIRRLAAEGRLGEIRKMVAMDGHQGPKEIGVGPEFLGWLTDPQKNGAGALYDFGCYGANLMTWLMEGRRPVSVTAVTRRYKPAIYARVDDEATVLVDYDGAQGIIEASWNWPFNRKDLEVYGATGYAVAIGGNLLKTRLAGARAESSEEPPELPADERDSISYLRAVARGKLKPAGLSSLENNLVVTEILEAARRSAATGRKVELGGRR
jgi:predicted dehydrogenase